MSSESEDEFQSADEGSDVEDLKYSSRSAVFSQLPSESAASHRRAEENYEDEILDEIVREKLNKATLNLESDVDTKNKEDISEYVEALKQPEKCNPVNVICISKAESVSPSVSNIQGDESIIDKPRNQLDDDKGCEKIIAGEVCGKVNACVKEFQEITVKSDKRDDVCLPEKLISDKENDAAQFKDVVEDSEEKCRTTKQKLKSLSQTSTSENSKTEHRTDKNEDCVPDSKPRPIRQSKIGMKKPREKLGERLGARKLGAKVATKSIDSISSTDTTKHKGEEDKSISTYGNDCPVVAQNVGDNREEEDKKVKKRQQWEEQQERWHQALNLDKDKKKASSEDGDGWSAPWGGWGGTLLSAATTFTREVGRGVGTVMETVESSIGVPSPEVMAQELCEQDHLEKVLEEKNTLGVVGEGKKTKVEKQSVSEKGNDERSEQRMDARYGLGGFSLGSLVSGVSGALETASSKVLMGGLDTLEVIGRKAMDAIQEGDPGLHRKRAFLSNKKPNLSQTLQEARQRAIEEEKEGVISGRNKNLQKPSFEQAWEATEGPVHLEALSLVAKQCQTKKASVIAMLPHYVQEKLLSENAVIKSTCELEEHVQAEEEEEEVAEVVAGVVVKMGLPLHPQRLVEAWTSVKERATFIQEAGFKETEGVEGALYRTMAQFVAQFCAIAHKGGELALITPETNPLELASHFKEVAQVVSCSLENVADQVCGSITSKGSATDVQVNNTITNIYLQAASGNNYIQESLMLLASVLQYSNTKSAAARH